jgi:hypothetical protein
MHMTYIKVACLMLLLCAALLLPTAPSVNALSVGSMPGSARNMSMMPGLVRAKLSFCEAQYRKCTAGCKKDDLCMTGCAFDKSWCEGFCPNGPKPC